MLADIDPELLKYASPEELKALEKAGKLELALSGPLAFARYVSPETEEYKHLIYLDGLIVALVEHRLYIGGPGLPGVKGEDGIWRHPVSGELVILKLMVSMPPRHGKSYLISEHATAWFVARYPDKRVLLASYEADFAASWGLKARRHIEDHPEFGILLDQSSRSGARWDVADRRGGMMCSGAGGSITGKGKDFGVLDDPIKNAEDALSPATRDGQEVWWYSVFSNRKEPDAVDMVVLTRWHEDDIAGRLEEKEKGKWFVVNLPALAFEEVNDEGISIDTEHGDMADPLGRKPGEALCPERYPAGVLEEIRDSPSEAGRLWFSAQYQGRPSMAEMGYFPKGDFRYYTRDHRHYNLVTDLGTEIVELKNIFRFITVDLAASVKSAADWTVFACWDVIPGNRLVLVDRYRERLETPDHVSKLRVFVQGLQGPDEPKLRFVGVEKATYGLSLIQNLVREPGFIVRPMEPDKDKISRAIPAGQAVMNHQVFFPKNAPWIDEWTKELIKFDKGRHDDQVDVFSYAVEMWRDLPVSVREPKFIATTLDERNQKRLKELDRPKKRYRIHAELGRWG